MGLSVYLVGYDSIHSVTMGVSYVTGFVDYLALLSNSSGDPVGGLTHSAVGTSVVTSLVVCMGCG